VSEVLPFLLLLLLLLPLLLHHCRFTCCSRWGKGR